MKARDLIRAIENWGTKPEAALRELTDDQFKIAFWASVELFKTLKAEAERRGIWDELTRKKVK